MEISPPPLLLLLLFTSIVVLTTTTTATTTTTDVYTEVLLDLKSQVLDHYNGLEDWFLPSTKPPSEQITACSWSGVSCNSNSTMVIGLDLSRRGLSGEISRVNFGVLGDLVTLNLSHNLLSGQLPVSIFNLTNLRNLDISRNNFSGHFPSGVSGLRKLVVLDAFSNSFSGHLPEEIAQIETLKVVNFAGSYFSGGIPDQYGEFKSIEFLHLAGNLLGGEIPWQLGSLQTIKHMEIGYNSYQGGIPWQLGNMSELQYLDIAGANLSGPLPKELSNLTKLESLFLFRNHLSGFLPKEFSKLGGLKSLDLSDNLIAGSIPESFSELKNLTLLSLMYNQMSGAVPEAIAELPKLETLLIWDNFFSGSLPKTLGLNSNLIELDVSTNNLTGEIPPNLCANGMLSKLILFSNHFTGVIPDSLSNCSSLVRIRFEDNALSGNITLKFSSLGEISYVDLSRNNFTGGVPEEVLQASKLEYLNVSQNPQLGGNLPAKIWSLPVLQNFSASYCNISGTIPTFESCKESLTVIELSSNTLSGNIPPTVSNCQGLSVLDLSQNNLSGPIPEKLKNLELLNVSLNPKLCGMPPLFHPCSGSSKDVGTEFLWVLILCIAVVSLIALGVSGVCYIQKNRRNRQWKMVSFSGLPKFTPNDILNGLNSAQVTSSVCRITLPTGITVLVKEIECDPQKMDSLEEWIIRMGNARHKNLVRLLGYCHNNSLVYLLYDCFPNGSLGERFDGKEKLDWGTKCKIVMGVVKGLYFLHHECYPAIPHGDLRASNVVFDERMEPRMAEFGVRFLMQLNKGSFGSSKMQPGQFNAAIKEELYMDIYNLGGIVLEILTNGRLNHLSQSLQNKPTEDLLEAICSDNELAGPKHSSARKEINLMLEVALLCTRSRSSERPSMEDVLKLLSGSK